MNLRATSLVFAIGMLVLGVVLFFYYQHESEPTRFAAIQPVEQPAGTLVRLGTYDNRAIAIAYHNSKHFDLAGINAKKREMADAKAAGDERRAAELESWGIHQQQLAHFRGFGRYPVDDLLAHVSDGVAQLAKERDLDAIVWLVDHRCDNVELVDVTMDLVALFEPSEKGLAWAEQACERAPLSFEELIVLDPRE